jgi:hypothetical protein
MCACITLSLSLSLHFLLYEFVRARGSRYSHEHMQSRTYARLPARTHSRTHARTHTRTHAHTHTRTHAHTHTHAYARPRSSLAHSTGAQNVVHEHTHAARAAVPRRRCVECGGGREREGFAAFGTTGSCGGNFHCPSPSSCAARAMYVLSGGRRGQGGDSRVYPMRMRGPVGLGL